MNARPNGAISATSIALFWFSLVLTAPGWWVGYQGETDEVGPTGFVRVAERLHFHWMGSVPFDPDAPPPVLGRAVDQDGVFGCCDNAELRLLPVDDRDWTRSDDESQTGLHERATTLRVFRAGFAHSPRRAVVMAASKSSSHPGSRLRSATICLPLINGHREWLASVAPYDLGPGLRRDERCGGG
jgi:hypothetical protein